MRNVCPCPCSARESCRIFLRIYVSGCSPAVVFERECVGAFPRIDISGCRRPCRSIRSLGFGVSQEHEGGCKQGSLEGPTPHAHELRGSQWTTTMISPGQPQYRRLPQISQHITPRRGSPELHTHQQRTSSEPQSREVPHFLSYRARSSRRWGEPAGQLTHNSQR